MFFFLVIFATLQGGKKRGESAQVTKDFGVGGGAKWAQVTTLWEGKKLKSPNYKSNPKYISSSPFWPLAKFG